MFRHHEVRISTYLICVFSLAMEASASGFFTVTNKAELGRRADILYLYAVSVDSGSIEVRNSADTVKFAYSRNLRRTSDNLVFGCYLTFRKPNKQSGVRYGVYHWQGTFANSEKTVTSFVKPPTALLNTREVYTINVYPDSADTTVLDEPLKFGVEWTTGCPAIKWLKSGRRIGNTGPTLTLTKVEGTAGIYTIYRGKRRQRGWAVYIQVIVSDCPRGKYTSDPANECMANCLDCKNGGICDENGDCRCPPFFTGETCLWPDVWVKRPGTQHYYYIGYQAMSYSNAQTQCMALGGYLASVTSEAENQFIVDLLNNYHDVNPTGTLAFIGLSHDGANFVWSNGEPFVYNNWDNNPYFIELTEHITCGDLPGGNNKCKGYHFCYGGLFGCSCANGWSGNACDKKCCPGFYGAGCAFRCIEDAGCPTDDCDRFTGRCFY